MEGRDHRGVIWLACSSGGERSEAWERWHAEVRLAELEGVDGVERAVRFELAPGFELPDTPDTPDAPTATHVVVLETSGDDVVAVARRIPAGDGRGPCPAARESATAYRWISRQGDPTGRSLGGVVAVLTDCSDPAGEDAFNAWYEEHARYVVAHLGHYAVERYVNTDAASEAARYLALYETESDDPGQVQRDGWEAYFAAEHTESHAAPESLVLRGEVALEPRR